MLITIKAIRKENKSLGTYLYYLCKTGRLKTHIDANGYICYDSEEYLSYKKSVKIGAPIKNLKGRKIEKC
jgi:hypothetical protein